MQKKTLVLPTKLTGMLKSALGGNHCFVLHIRPYHRQYFCTGDDTATYLSTVCAMSIKIDAVYKIKYKMCKILISTMFS